MYRLVGSSPGHQGLDKSSQKEEVSIALTLFTVEVYRECCRCGVGVSIENPLSSRIWEFFLFQELIALPASRFIAFDLCRYGSEYRKATGVLTTVASLEQLARRCNHPYRHIPAAGSVRVRDGGRYRWVARTTLAGAYPPQLCTKWAGLIQSQSSPAALSRPRDAAAMAFNFVATLESLVRRGQGSTGHARGAASATEQQLRGAGDSECLTYGGADSTVGAAAKFLKSHRVVFGGSSGARGGAEGQSRQV